MAWFLLRTRITHQVAGTLCESGCEAVATGAAVRLNRLGGLPSTGRAVGVLWTLWPPRDTPWSWSAGLARTSGQLISSFVILASLRGKAMFSRTVMWG